MAKKGINGEKKHKWRKDALKKAQIFELLFGYWQWMNLYGPIGTMGMKKILICWRNGNEREDWIIGEKSTKCDLYLQIVSHFDLEGQNDSSFTQLACLSFL